MSQKDFIKLEYDIFSRFDEETVLFIIASGIAKEMRDYAEAHNYEITEDDLLKIIFTKFLQNSYNFST